MMAELMCGQVTHIVDPNDFWLRMGTEADLASFEEFEQHLNAVMRTLPVGSTDSVTEGSIVLVCCSNSKSGNVMQWKRATIIRVDQQRNAFDVFYVDYGNTEIVPASRICPLIPDVVQQFQPICYRCALAGIRPIARSWTSRAVRTFEKLALHKHLKVALVSYDHGTMSHRVSLYQSGDAERSVTHHLLDAETGLPTDERVEEYARDVVPVSSEDLYGCSVNDEGMDPALEHTNFEASNKVEGDAQSHIPSYNYEEWGDGGAGACNDWNHGAGAGYGQSADAAEQEITSPYSTSVVVPQFNLSTLQQRQGLSADELQKEREERERAERKARLQKDMIECNRLLDNMDMGMGQGQKWGNTDLLIGRQTSEEGAPNLLGLHNYPADYHDSAAGGCGSHVADDGDDAARGGGEREDNGQCEGGIVGQRLGSLAEQASDTHISSPYQPAGDGSAPPDSSGMDLYPDSQYEEPAMLKLGNHSTAYDARQMGPFPPPPKPKASWSPEEAEYRKQEYIKQVLQEAVAMDGVDVDVLCAHFHCLVSLDPDHSEEEMRTLMEALLEEAVKDEAVSDLALQVIGSYSSVLKGVELHDLLKYGSEKFVKMPVGKMPAYHTKYAEMIVKLLYVALDWPAVLQTVVQDFVVHCLEKWTIFNKRGSQTGVIHRKLEDIYLDCLEQVLPASFSILQASETEHWTFVVQEMREKVLETDVDYQVRSRLLTLLIKYSDLYGNTRPHADKNESCVTAPTRHQGVQVDEAGLRPPPNTREDEISVGKGRPTPTTASSTQTELCLLRDAGQQWLGGKDAAAQTEGSSEVSSSRRTSGGSMDSWQASILSVDRAEGSSPTVPGRARRRRAVLEHFSKQGRSGTVASENCSPISPSSATSDSVSPFTFGLYSQPPSKAEEGAKVTKTVSECGAEESAGHHVLAGSSDKQEMLSLSQRNNSTEGTCVTGETNDAAGDGQEREQHQGHVGETLLDCNSTPVTDQNRSAQPSSASSFLSTVSSVSRSAFLSIFGTRTSSTDPEHGQTTPSLNLAEFDSSDAMTDDSSDENEGMFEEPPPGEASSALGHSQLSWHSTEPGSEVDGFTRSLYSADRAPGVLPSVVTGSQGAALHSGFEVTTPPGFEAGFRDRGPSFSMEQSGQLQSSPYGSTKKSSNTISEVFPQVRGKMPQSYSSKTKAISSQLFEEDFPPLEKTVVPGNQSWGMTPSHTQHSLQAIAADVLLISEEQEGQSKPTEGDIPVDPDTSTDRPCNSEERDERDSVPSDWEDHLSLTDGDLVSPSASTGGSDRDNSFDRLEGHSSNKGNPREKKGAADQDTVYRSQFVDKTQEYMNRGSGDEFRDGGFDARPVQALDPAGDRASPHLSLLTHSPDQGNCSPYALSDEELSRGLGGSRVSPVPSAPLQNYSSPVPYERRDLAFMANEKSSGKSKGKRKFTYRPLDTRVVPVVTAEREPRQKWMPTRMKCTNCGSEEHLKQDCPKPARQLIF